MIFLIFLLALVFCENQAAAAAGANGATEAPRENQAVAASTTTTDNVVVVKENSDDDDDDHFAPHVMWAQRTDKILLKIVENHITNEHVNITRRGISVTFEAGMNCIFYIYKKINLFNDFGC